jgi:tetratricopeptide (TPR) repeat protein
METDRFARARVLIEQNRCDLAINEVTARLADDPDDPEGHILLAFCLNATNRPEAWETARRAVELAPDDARAHFAVSLTETRRGNLNEAEAAVRRAIGLNSWNAGYFGQLAAIELVRHRWTDALRAADEGLALDPDDDVCLNNRAVALTKLGRHDEASRTLEGTLEKHPEDAFSHANRGWSLLHQNESKQAVIHFRESLRLNPNSEWAKEGLLEALRAKSWFYRRVLQVFLRLSRFPPKVQFGLIIGLVILVRFLDNVAERAPAIAPFLNLLIFGYIAFVAATWFAKHIANVLLLFNADGRMLLDRTEKWVSGLCTALLLLTLVLAGVAIASRDDTYIHSAIFAFLLAIHFSSIMHIPYGRFRLIGAAVSALVLGLFVWEKVERAYLLQDVWPLRSRELELKADEKAFQLRRSSLDEHVIQETTAALANRKAELDRAAKDLLQRAERLNTWELVINIGSLGVLLLHVHLASKARRVKYE